MRVSFDEDLATLHEEIVTMLSMTQNAIDDAMTALKSLDMELAKKVIEGDEAIDKQEQKIEKLCIDMIVRQAPLAKDLRRITSTFKLITDLERIADHAEDICAIIIKTFRQRHIKPLVDLPKMAQIARSMVARAITAYLHGDVELAREVCVADQEADDLYELVYNELIQMMKNNPGIVEQGVALISIAKYFERIADHATNVCEWVVFTEMGTHNHLASDN